MSRRTEVVPFGRLIDRVDCDDAHLLLRKDLPGPFGDVKLIRFASRKALEAFNKKANLRPLVYTLVPDGNVAWMHQKRASLVYTGHRYVDRHTLELRTME